ncbi:hypothetical protein [Spartinivicinus poritis]|uniref:Uncharacterized protein n=1 Tax=Spartinivicinus poritis TaxID=2994640 RepID=A0ABT5U6Y6_9GAMM|nr:hypothetical protein [Spartinivicinus sp. A2-2]MDE1462125.1 hypothetical protein [Spartinivicinus sp. A2-2]
MNSLTIPNRGPTETAQDFFALRDQGVELIQHLASETWTDHNLHDPGITFLESACYAMTDLGYRLDFSVPDWMATPDDTDESLAFWGQPKVLPCEPVTADDLRQLILNVPGVRNVMAMPAPLFPWLWRISVIPEEGVDKNLLKGLVQQVFLQHRNLGEDLESPTESQGSTDTGLPGLQILDSYDLIIRLKVRITDGKDTVETLAQLLARFIALISPSVPFRSLAELLAKGISFESLHTGPWLIRGYSDENELQEPVLKDTLYVSRLMTEGLAVEGVEQVDRLEITGASEPSEQDWEPWIYPLQTNKAPHLNIEKTLSYMAVLKNGISVSFSANDVCERVKELMQPGISPGRKVDEHAGENRELANYVPIQHELPVTYGVGTAGIAANESGQRIEQIRRLQAYLLFMDQVLTNQFAQLAHTHQLMCVPKAELWHLLGGLLEKMQGSETLSDAEVGAFWQLVSQLPASHQSQSVDDITDVEQILTKSVADYQSPDFNQLTERPFGEKHLLRLNRGMEHLLARHHETVPDDSVLKYEELFCHYSEVLLNHPDAPLMTTSQLNKRLAKLKCVVDKALFILDVPQVGPLRGQGHHYLNDAIWGEANVVGFKYRVYRQLGLPVVMSKLLSANNYEGFHCVEGTLLRHGVNPSNYPETAIPHLVFIVLPNWPTRFQNTTFQELIYQAVFEQLPAHLSPLLLFLDRADMAIFEKAYCAWRNAMLFVYANAHVDERKTRIEAAAKVLNECLTEFKNNRPYTIDPEDFQHSKIGDERYPIGKFIIGYQSAALLNYPPNDKDFGCIGQGAINPGPNSVHDPFVIRVKAPNHLCLSN